MGSVMVKKDGGIFVNSFPSNSVCCENVTSIIHTRV